MQIDGALLETKAIFLEAGIHRVGGTLFAFPVRRLRNDLKWLEWKWDLSSIKVNVSQTETDIGGGYDKP